MLDSFLTFINQHTPGLKQQPTLLAVSGGIDSVVMAHLFHNLALPAAIAHCNFGLRGEESDGDEAFVRALAEKLGFPFFVSKPDTKALVQTASVSTQMAARELRYHWFENLRVGHGYHWIATAHHAADSLETVLLNLARGTGLAGLTGIAPVNGHLIRPLLYANRKWIAEYAAAHDIAWREDRTNFTDDYHRNKIRHHVVPVLAQLNPSLENTFNASAERLRAAHSLLKESLNEWKAAVMQKEGRLIRIAISGVTSKSEPSYRLWSILQDFAFQYSQMGQIFAALSGIPGKVFHSPSHSLLIDRHYLILKPIEKPGAVGALVIESVQDVFEWGHIKLNMAAATIGEPLYFDKTRIAVDADLLSFPLTLRKWREGDIFQPFGMSGQRKKVSDLLIDQKLDRFEKDQTAVLLNGNGDIIWVIGIRADNRFKITDRTQSMLTITVLPQ